jgi:hypothetical protein
VRRSPGPEHQRLRVGHRDLATHLLGVGLAQQQRPDAATVQERDTGEVQLGLAAWATTLAGMYAGWDGDRTWESLEHDARIQARHDGRGHVTLRFVLRGPRGYDRNAWEASVTVTVDAEEDMRSLARDLDTFIASGA